MKPEKIQSVTLKIGGMICINCQARIQERLEKLDGVLSANVSWKNASAKIEYDGAKITLQKIAAEIEKLDYKVRGSGESCEKTAKLSETFFYIAVIALLFLFLQKTGVMNLLVPSSLASSKMSYALLFVTGVFTSVHCVAMCGGINLSQSLPKMTRQGGKGQAFLPPLFYNLGRVASYTIIGLAFGTAGFLLGGGSGSEPGLSLSVQGILKIIAGLVMLLMGISLLGIFPFLRNITPHLPAFISKKIASAQRKNSAPFAVGFLNGFMPCGPLQAMWVVSLAAASPLSGALSMFAFALGTVPLMLALGSIVSVLGKKYTRVVMKIGAVLVVVMALSMMSQGFALGGWGSSDKNSTKKSGPGITLQDGKQVVKSTLNPYRYPEITVKKGVPVHWEIEADESSLNGCNYRMIFRDLGFQYQMGYGTNVIEFTPEKEGTFQYTCWMGMVRGTITVVE